MAPIARIRKLTDILIIVVQFLLAAIVVMLGIITASAVVSKGWLALPAAILFVALVVAFVFSARGAIELVRHRD